MKHAIELLERAQAEALSNAPGYWAEAEAHEKAGNHDRASNLKQHGTRCYDVAEDCGKALEILKAAR